MNKLKENIAIRMMALIIGLVATISLGAQNLALNDGLVEEETGIYSEDLAQCPIPTSAVVVSGNGCMAVGQSSVNVQISVTGQSGATYRLWNQQNPDDDDIEYDWNKPRSGTVGSLNYTASATGTYTLWVSQENTSCTESPRRSVTFSVYQSPTIDNTGLSTTGTNTYCEGTPFSVSLSGSQNNSLVQYFLQYKPSGGSFSDLSGAPLFTGNGSGYTWTGLTLAGTYRVQARTTCNGLSGVVSGEAVVTLDPKAQAYSLQQSKLDCPGGSDFRVKLMGSQGNYVYKIYETGGSTTALETWTSPSNGATHEFVVANTGNYYVEALNQGACAGSTTSMSNTQTVVAFSEPSLPNAITAISKCVGESVTLTPSGGGTDVSTYRWYTTATGGGTHNADATSITFNAVVGATDYYIAAVSGNGCVGPRRKVTVTGNAIPSAPGGLSSQSYCEGSRPTMTPSGATSYRWYTASSGGVLVHTGTSFQPTLAQLSNTLTTYHVAAVSAQNCESTNRTAITLTKSSLPDVFEIEQTVFDCDGGTNLEVGLKDSQSGYTYKLYKEGSGTVLGTWQSPTNNVTHSFPVSSTGRYYIVAVNQGGCTGTTEMQNRVDVITYPVTPTPNAIANVSVCEGESVTLSPSITGNTAETYVWYTTLAGLSKHNADASSITFNATLGTTDYYIAAVLNGCISPTRRKVTVTGMARLAPPSHAASLEVCHDATSATLSLANISGNGSYKVYSLASGGTLLGSGSDDITLAISGQSTTVHIERINGNGCESTSRTPVTITKLSVPLTQTLSDFGVDAYCDNTTLTLDDSENGMIYELYRGTTLVQTQTGTGQALPWNNVTTTGDYEVKAYHSGCNPISISNTVSIVVESVTPYIVYGGGTACEIDGEQVSLQNSQSAFEYYLKKDGVVDISSRQTGTGGTMNWTDIRESGNYTVVAFSNGCGYVDMNQSVNVTITEVPPAPVVTDIVVYTGQSAPKLILATPVPGATVKWYDSNGNYLQDGNTYGLTTVTQSLTLYAEANLNGCPSERVEAHVTFTSAYPPDGVQQVQACDQQYLQKVGNPPADAVWYWQDEQYGTDKTWNAAKYDYRLVKEGKYYLRAYDTKNRIWGPESTAANGGNSISLTEPARIIPIVNCDDINAMHVEDVPDAYEATGNYNWMRSFDVLRPDMTVTQIENETDNRNVIVTTSYVDGLGRPIQTVGRAISPNGKDMVESIFYDELGRQTRKYLPFESTESDGSIKSDPFDDQKNFYGGDVSQSIDAHFPDESVYYSKVIKENSPLGRPIIEMAEGDAWAGSGVGHVSDYTVNTASDGVRIWLLDINGIPYSNSGNVYATGELAVKISKDEDGKIVKKYIDKLQRTVLKKMQTDPLAADGHSGWMNTYFVYDDFGNVRYIISPKATKWLETAGWQWNTSVLGELVFEYTYDTRQRMVTKRVPGAERIDMVYDNLDRVVLYQDGNQRHKSPVPEWTFKKYDLQGREAIGGVYYSNLTREQLQGIADAWNKDFGVILSKPDASGVVVGSSITVSSHVPGTDTYHAEEEIVFLPGFNTSEEFETELGGALTTDYTSFMGYQDATFPLLKGSDFDILTVYYYDQYDFTEKAYDMSDPGFYPEAVNDPLNAVAPELTPYVMGSETGSRIKVLGSEGKWLTSVIYYDDQGRVIQTQSEHHTGGEDITKSQFDFEGKTLVSYKSQTNPGKSGGTNTEILTRAVYDENGRIVSEEQKLNSAGDFKEVASYVYNSLGQLKIKNLGEDPMQSQSPLEVLEYGYNIRGWKKDINKAYLDGTISDRFFSMELSYDVGYNKNYRNGNIAGVKWKTRSAANAVKSYGYGYDNANRLIKADYGQDGGVESNWSNTKIDFSSSYSYDINGNIQSLKREGVIAGTKITIDDLDYGYGLAGQINGETNQLLRVRDLMAEAEGFNNTNLDDLDYDYDHNGNLTLDNNKGILEITYNYMNLPQKVSFTGGRSIDYVYSANGIKLARVTSDNGSQVVTDYLSGFIYSDDELQHFAFSEGRVRKNPSGNLVYDYFIKDHLDNNRMTLTEDQEVKVYLATMETDITPGGMNLSEYEEALFLNLDQTRSSAVALANNTNEAGIVNNETARLNGSESDRRVGPAKLLQVNAGDQVDMEVFAYHQGGFSNGGNVGQSNFVTALATTFGGINGSSNTESQAIYDLFNDNAALAYVGGDGDSNSPQAYINYILFNQDFDYLDAGFVQVGNTANSHQQLNLSKSIDQSGYIYVYVSNESQANFNVYFDDLRITHAKGAIFDEEHYYPFGLSINNLSGSTSLSKPNYFKFGGKELQSDYDLNWFDYGARMYDPEIGRWNHVDPLADSYADTSPYAYAMNNPIRFTDPNGMNSEDKVRSATYITTTMDDGSLLVTVSHVTVTTWQAEDGETLVTTTVVESTTRIPSDDDYEVTPGDVTYSSITTEKGEVVNEYKTKIARDSKTAEKAIGELDKAVGELKAYVDEHNGKHLNEVVHANSKKIMGTAAAGGMLPWSLSGFFDWKRIGNVPPMASGPKVSDGQKMLGTGLKKIAPFTSVPGAVVYATDKILDPTKTTYIYRVIDDRYKDIPKRKDVSPQWVKDVLTWAGNAITFNW